MLHHKLFTSTIPTQPQWIRPILIGRSSDYIKIFLRYEHSGVRRSSQIEGGGCVYILNVLLKTKQQKRLFSFSFTICIFLGLIIGVMAEEEITVNRMAKPNTVNARPGQLKLYICPTTGGSVRVVVPTVETVHGLKVAIARKIRIPPERINLLFKNK